MNHEEREPFRWFNCGLTRRQDRKLDRILEELEKLNRRLDKEHQATTGKFSFPNPTPKE